MRFVYLFGILLLTTLNFTACIGIKDEPKRGDTINSSISDTNETTNSTTSDETNTTTLDISSNVTEAPLGSEKVPSLKEQKRRFQAEISKLDVDKTDKLVLLTHEYLGGSEYKEITNETTDKELIGNWIKLIEKMEFTARAFDPISGQGYVLYFHSGDEIITIGGMMLPYIYPAPAGSTLYLDNYQELYPEFVELEEALGFTR